MPESAKPPHRSVFPNKKQKKKFLLNIFLPYSEPLARMMSARIVQHLARIVAALLAYQYSVCADSIVAELQCTAAAHTASRCRVQSSGESSADSHSAVPFCAAGSTHEHPSQVRRLPVGQSSSMSLIQCERPCEALQEQVKNKLFGPRLFAATARTSSLLERASSPCPASAESSLSLSFSFSTRPPYALSQHSLPAYLTDRRSGCS